MSAIKPTAGAADRSGSAAGAPPFTPPLPQPASGRNSEQVYRQVLRADPGNIDALTNLARLCLQTGRAEEAVRLLRRAINNRPKIAELHFSLGNTLWVTGRASEAVDRYEKAIALKPEYVDALNHLGGTLLGLGRYQEAIERFEQTIALSPKFAAGFNNLANALRAAGRIDDAIPRYREALALDPSLTEALNNLGCALHGVGENREAVEVFHKALEQRPDYVEAHLHRGMALVVLGRQAEALEHFQTAIKLRPDDAEGYGKAGAALVELGRFAEARTAFERALALAPERADIHLNFALSKKFSADDPQLAALETLVGKKDLSSADLMQIHFALGKADADLGADARSLEHFLAGNALQRAQAAYDETETARRFAHAEKIFTPAFLAARRDLGHPTDKPVFIVGMPRSGTTLVEQILASHPQVFGGGEFTDLDKLVEALAGEGRDYLDVIPDLPAAAFAQLGADYVARISADSGDASRITDKMPFNFRYLGLIALALPRARIIHVMRDPIDTCVSCFTKLFGGDLAFAYDLAELGRYYRRYQRLMQHWRNLLPDRLLEVQYEELVDDVDTQARRIVAHAGLDWDERCLAFYENQRPVRTASVIQVRQPIYRSSIGRWRKYGDLLRPLIDALEEPDGEIAAS